LRILNLLPHLSGGGAERQFGYLAPELVRMGHRVDAAYLSSGPAKPELNGVMMHPLRAANNYDPYLFWQLVRLIRGVRPDIIHTWILQMDILGGVVAGLNGVPWVLAEPSSELAHSQTWKHRLRVRVGSGASAIVCNSRGGDEYWKTLLPYSRRYIVPNGLPLDLIGRTAAALPPGLPRSDTDVVLYVGRLVSDVTGNKNLKALFAALAYVSQRQKVLAILCGAGPQRGELQTMTQKMGLEPNVHFTGYLPTPSVWALMKKASVFVSLSAYEGRPNAVMEAMACGCPLVLSDIPAHREILDESCALFVDPSNIQQTADAIVQILRNADAGKVRALIAKEKTMGWSVAGMARNYEKLYGEILSSQEHKLNNRTKG
jgi:glycosyltransferase involved in cell wall biosynthesis